MDFDLNKAQKLLQQSARDFFARECKPERVRELMATDTAYDDGLWRAMADQGWTGLIIPEEFGGLGLSLVDLIAVSEEMGRACLPGPFLSTLWAAALIDRADGEGQRKQYLEPIAAGDMKATVALLEGDADWNPESVQLRAEKEGKEFRLRGRKEFVTDAEVADLIICVARGNDGLLLAPVEKATATAVVALCAEMLGVMQWTLENAVEYAKTRQQFGKQIGVYQAVQHQLADMFLMTEGARSAAYYAAWAVSENDPSAKLAVSVAKACCSDAAREVGNRGAQVHGGIGFTWEHNLQLYYKRAKASEIMFGDANYHREEIARKVVDGDEG